MLAKSIQSKEVILVHVVAEILLPHMISNYYLRSYSTGETIIPHEYARELYQEIKVNVLEMLEDFKAKSQHAILPEPTDEDRKKQGAVPSSSPSPRFITNIRTKVYMLGRPQDKILELQEKRE